MPRLHHSSYKNKNRGLTPSAQASLAFVALLGLSGAQAQTAPAAEAQLREITVRDASNDLSAVKVDEAAVTRSGASILDTPQTLSVIPVQTTLDQAAQTIGDVVRNTAGARPSNYYGTYESVYARGFWMTTTSNYLRNGFRWVHLSQPAKRNVERYELLKGPAGLDYGRVEPGALMNIVTKKPLSTAYREVTVSASQGNGWDTGFDLTGPLNAEGTVLYRLNGGTGRQAFVSSAVAPRQDDLAGALTFKLSRDTQVDLDFEYTDRNQLIYPGLAVPNPRDASSADALPVGNFYGEPSNQFDGTHKLFTARLQHRFNDEWSANLGLSSNKTSRDVKQIRILGVTGNTVTRSTFPFRQEYDATTVQAELKGDLRLANMRHRMTFTLDRSGYESTDSGGGNSAVAPVSLFNPQPTGVNLTYGTESRSKVQDAGFAMQDYIELSPHFSVLAGLRHSKYRQVRPNAADQTGDSTDPTLALIFKPESWVSIYGSVARSFTPNAGTLVAPNTYADPSRGKQLELGVKADWLDGRLRTTAAVYDLRKTNVPTPSPVNPLFSVLSGEQRSKGLELEAVGQLTHAWNLIASWGITDAKITRDNVAANVGKTPTQTPRTTASLWSTHRLSGAAAGWTVGGGLFHTGSKFVANDNRVSIPAYTIADLMASYQFKSGLPGAKLQFNLRNLFDKRHYEGGASGAAGFTNLYPGMPRTLSASLTVPF